jgi:hypothetical protein
MLSNNVHPACCTCFSVSQGKSAGETIGKALPPGHVPEEVATRIKKMIRDGPRAQAKPKAAEAEFRCLCSIS